MRTVLCGVLLAVVACFAIGEVYAQDLPRRTAVELWRLGGADAVEHEAFIREPPLVVDASGNLFARLSNPPGISVFDPEGNFVRSIGRSGEGPGEFQSPSGHGLLGDTLWVLNWPTPRVSRFLTDGTHLSTTQLDVIDFGVGLSSSQSVSALLRGGHAVAVPNGTPVEGTGRVRLPVLFGDLERPDREIAEVSLPRGMMIAGVGSFAFEPVSLPPLFVPCPSGDGYLTVNWDDNGTGEVRLSRYDFEGGHRWTRTVTVGTSQIPDGTRAEWIADGVEMARPHVEPAISEGRLRGGSVDSHVQDALDLPTYFPPVHAVVLGVDGSIWLGHTSMGDDREWWVLDEDGVLQFSVQLPSSVNVRAAREMSVWGTHLGEFDVPLVSRFEIE